MNIFHFNKEISKIHFFKENLMNSVLKLEIPTHNGNIQNS